MINGTDEEKLVSVLANEEAVKKRMELADTNAKWGGLGQHNEMLPVYTQRQRHPMSAGFGSEDTALKLHIHSP